MHQPLRVPKWWMRWAQWACRNRPRFLPYVYLQIVKAAFGAFT